MNETPTVRYEHQIWQLADLYDIIQLQSASETLADYAKHVAPLHLQLATINGKRDMIVPSENFTTSADLYRNLSGMFAAADNTGSLTIDYADQARNYRDGFLPVILDIRSGNIITTGVKASSDLRSQDADHTRTGGLTRVLRNIYETEETYKQPPLFPAIFEHMSKVIPHYKASPI